MIAASATRSRGSAQAGSGVPGFTAGTEWHAVTGLGIPANAATFLHALAGG